MARTGKIARLPRQLRNELNQRIDEGHPAAAILEWLNELEEVQLLLDDSFDGKPISECNLTAWRQGGYLDWKQHEKSCQWVRQLSNQSDQVAEESGLMPLSDRVSSLASLTLSKLLQNLDADDALEDAGKRDTFLAVLRQLTQLRREDREAARLKIELERHEKEKKREERASRAAAAYVASRGH